MISTSNPEQKEQGEVRHDGMNDAGHEAQMPKGGQSIKQTDANENTHKQK